MRLATCNVLILLLLLWCSVHTGNGECPTIVTRAQWGAEPPEEREALKVLPPPFVVIHHSEGQSCETEAQCKSRVKGIQDYHMNIRNWSDIGYNFLVGADGNVYEGRGWGIRGAHSPAYNTKSIGVCLLGRFQAKIPSRLHLETVKKLLSCGTSRGEIATQYHLIGHRQGSATDCPGDALFKEISSWPHFDPNPSPLLNN